MIAILAVIQSKGNSKRLHTYAYLLDRRSIKVNVATSLTSAPVRFFTKQRHNQGYRFNRVKFATFAGDSFEFMLIL